MAYGRPEQRCPGTKGGRNSHKRWLKRTAHKTRRIAWRQAAVDQPTAYRGYET